jgi:hypothetical protein
MSTEKPAGLSTPMAIVIGSVVIAFGLYMGLRSSKNEGQPALPTVTPSAKEAPAAPPPVPTAKPASPVDKVRVIREATAALDQHKKSLTEKCLAPSLAKKPDPPNVKYLFNLTFDAAGKIIARGVTEDRATSRPEVLGCVSENFPTVGVTPPGQTVLVDVPLELP